MYSLFKYNKAGHMKVLKEEAYADGVAEGRRRIIELMFKKGEI